MANLDTRGGFIPLDRLNGGNWTGQLRRYKKEASVILAPGDPVVLTGDSTADGVPLIDRAASASGTITGIVNHIDPIRTDLSKKHMAAADTGFVYVIDDPTVLFELQEDSDGGSLAGTDVGRGADIIVANANTTTGISQVMLDSSTAGQAQVQIMGLVQREDNAIGTYARWIVRINEHTYNATATLI